MQYDIVDPTRENTNPACVVLEILPHIISERYRINSMDWNRKIVVFKIKIDNPASIILFASSTKISDEKLSNVSSEILLMSIRSPLYPEWIIFLEADITESILK